MNHPTSHKTLINPGFRGGEIHVVSQLTKN